MLDARAPGFFAFQLLCTFSSFFLTLWTHLAIDSELKYFSEQEHCLQVLIKAPRCIKAGSQYDARRCVALRFNL